MNASLRLLPSGRISLAVTLAAASLFMCGATLTRAESQAGASGASSAKAAPYQLDKRPMPKGQDLETLLPRKVGTFTREAFPAGTKPSDSEDINIDYKAGADTVNVGFSIPGAKDAHEGIRTAKTETIAELKRLKRASEIPTAQELIGPPTSYYKVKDFIAWTRGGYFFYAKANNAAALDAFMAAFPY